MDVGMVLEALAPRVQHQQPANGRSQSFRIRGDLEQRLRGGTKQEVVHDALVAEREARQRLRHRENEVDVAHRQELRLPRGDPRVPCRGETLGDNADPGSCCRRGPAAHTAHSDRDARRAPRCGTARSRGAHADAAR